MVEYISREAVTNLSYYHGIRATYDNPMPDGVDAVDVIDIEKIPAADVVEVKHGWWVNDDAWPTCNKCGSLAPIDVDEWDFRGKIRPHMADYCPNCGVKMDGGTNDAAD